MRNMERHKRVRQFETLENRSMLAGNVTAAVAGGNLTITGDNSANILTLKELSGNRWQITGAGTKINGRTQTFTTAAVTGGVVISLNGGADSLVMTKGSIAAQLTILMGNGNDTATLSNLNVGRYLHFEGNSGNDVFVASNFKVSNPTFEFFSTIDMQDGNDTVALTNFFDQDLEVTLGRGNDTFAIDNSKFLGGPFQRLEIDAGDGTDVVSLVSVATVPLTIEMGPGKNDVLSLVKCTATTAALLDTGGTTGIISGVLNDFGSQFIDPNFTIRSGDLVNNT
jgi:hypothetical protein